MASVAFQSLHKAYGGRPALDGFDLVVEPQSFTVLCGPPKAGKSVLFRLLVGLEQPDSGRIVLDGRDITDLPPAKRHVGYVPQSFALYPHLSVRDNIGYALALMNTRRDEIARRVDRAAGILSITHLLDKRPDQLSGGEKQRTALARGLLKDASLFVLDDPLVGLDYKLRERLMDELKSLRQELKSTFLYATSDSLEALTVAQQLVAIDRGRVVQHGEAVRLYREPRHLRALEIVGFPQANVIDGVVAGGVVEAGPFRFPVNGSVRAGPVRVGFRPEAVRPPAEGAGAVPDGLTGRASISLVENLGGDIVVYLDLAGTALVMSLPAGGTVEPVFGGEMLVSVDPQDVLLFDPVDGRLL